MRKARQKIQIPVEGPSSHIPHFEFSGQVNINSNRPRCQQKCDRTRSWKFKRKSYLLTIIAIFTMLATKRIPVTEAVWNELSDLKAAGQTYSELLEEMIEERKKARLFRDMERIEAESEFVELPW